MAVSGVGNESTEVAASSASAASIRSTTLFTLTWASVLTPLAFRPAGVQLAEDKQACEMKIHEWVSVLRHKAVSI